MIAIIKMHLRVVKVSNHKEIIDKLKERIMKILEVHKKKLKVQQEIKELKGRLKYPIYVCMRHGLIELKEMTKHEVVKGNPDLVMVLVTGKFTTAYGIVCFLPLDIGYTP